MIRYLPLLLFIGLAWGKDIYPYFTDPKDQLNFEEQRIYIKDVSNQRQIISGGGDRFNWWSLLIESEPRYLNAPITTSFYYDYSFEILQNGKQLNEVEFLRLIGLNDKANKIISNHKVSLENWENTKPRIIKKGNLGFTIIGYGMGFVGGFLGVTGIIFPAPPALYLTSAFCLWSGFKLIDIGKKEIVKTPKPVINQTLINEQIKSLAESFNRKIYDQISKE